ncbi:MAG: ABC-2 family transporter protein [Oscillospiraceae bacterium]|nr:ABC-2 family transporter protein [Oscillospiraceae bacterium]
MKKLRYYISVAAMFTKLSIQSELEYPFMLIGHILANSIQWVVGFATIKFVVDQFGSIGGWGYESLAFLYGMSVLSHGLAVVFYIQTWYMGYDVIEGEFDRFLLRPMNLVFQFLFSDFNLIGFTDMIPGLIVFFYGCAKVQLVPSLTNILLVICTLAGGTMIRGAVWMFCGSMSFWTKSTANFTDMVGELFERVSMYPITIYPKWVQAFFTFLLPLAWITFWPVKDMLELGITPIPVPLAVVTLIVGLLMFVGSCAVFKAGMGKYESAGS